MPEPNAQRPTGGGPLGRFARRHRVWTFLVLAFAFTWTWWGLAALRGEGGGPSPLIMIGALGPALSAIVLSRTGERSSDEPARRKHRRALLVAFPAAGGVLVLQVATGGKATLLGDPTLASLGIGVLDVALLVLTVLLVAVVLAAGRSPDRGIRARMASLLRWRLPVWGWITALLLVPAIFLTGALLAHLQGADVSLPPAAGHPWTEWLPLFVVGVLVTALFTGGLEEPGWRGFMLPELQRRFSPLTASLFIAVAWSLWHLPLHVSGFYEGPVVNQLVLRTVRTIPLAILFTWLYNRTGGSLLLVVVLHAMVNNSFVVTPVTWWALAPAVVLVGGLVLWDRMWRPLADGRSVPKPGGRERTAPSA